MRPTERATARRQLDKRLNGLRGDSRFVRPPKGWLKAVREALGMTTYQFAKRLGLSQPRAVAIEQAELRGAITLDSLEKAARALDCTLVYTLVPGKPLEEFIRERATLQAKKQIKTTAHSMTLEAQGVDSDDEKEQRERLIQKLIEKAGSKLWEEP